MLIALFTVNFSYLHVILRVSEASSGSYKIDRKLSFVSFPALQFSVQISDFSMCSETSQKEI